MIIRSLTSVCVALMLFCLPYTADATDGTVFQDAEGNNVSLQSFKGKAVLLNFWATWCGPCIAEMPELIALQKKYADLGLVVIPLSEDDKASDPIHYFKENRVTSPQVYFDKDHQLWNMIKPRGLPTTLLIDREGNEIQTFEGAIDPTKAQFKAAIAQLLHSN